VSLFLGMVQAQLIFAAENNVYLDAIRIIRSPSNETEALYQDMFQAGVFPSNLFSDYYTSGEQQIAGVQYNLVTGDRIEIRANGFHSTFTYEIIGLFCRGFLALDYQDGTSFMFDRELASSSVWRTFTKQNPYPNKKISKLTYQAYGAAGRNIDIRNFSVPFYFTQTPATPAAPTVVLEAFYESNPGQNITIDAIPTSGYPTSFTYQWYLAGFAISSAFGGTASGYTIDGTVEFEGTWRVVVSNSEGSAEAAFEYRVFTDSDSDGLSDGRELLVIGSDPNKLDTDGDELSDYDEVVTLLTDPTKQDTDGDGLRDDVESNTGTLISKTNTGTDPTNADSDGDGVADGLEVSSESDPNNAQSFDMFNQGLIAYYPFNGNANDESGNGNDGQPISVTAANGVTGDANSALRFDGLQSSVRVLDANGLRLAGDNTVTCWVELDDLSANQDLRLFGKGDFGNNRNYALHVNPVDHYWLYQQFTMTGGQENTASATPTITTSRWYHVTGVRSGSQRFLFIDGNLVAQGTTLATSTYTGAEDLVMGGAQYYSDRPHFHGALDQVRIYNRALSTSEVSALYTSEAPAVPALAINPLYESALGHSLVVDATPTGGNPTDFTYQWYFNGNPISSIFGGAAAIYTIDGSAGDNGLWKVLVTNSTGSTESNFKYYVLQDTDGDGLSDGKEIVVHGSDPGKKDTDEDGLNDYVEVTVHMTSPTLKDTDSDGFEDKYELTFGGDPKDAQSGPGGVMIIETAVEVRFHAVQGFTYKIQYSDDLSTWQDVEMGIQGTGTRIDRFFSAQDFPKRYFRFVKTSP
jgi:hypothetical protein